MSSANLPDELRAARRAVEQAQVHVRSLREQAAGSRVAGRLETDVRRVVEDLDDLAAETGADAEDGIDRAFARGPHSDVDPVPVPSSRRDEPEFQPECDDEGLGGGWHATPANTATNHTDRRRRSR